MKRYCIYLVFLFTLILPYQSKAMTLDEIMAPSFSVISRTQEVYLLLQGISLKEDNPLVSCNEMLAEILQNIQNETLLPDTRILFTKDMLTYALAGLFIVNMDYENHPEQKKYGREFYKYFLLSCAYLGAVTTDNQDEQEKIFREKIMYHVLNNLLKHRKQNMRTYIYKNGDNIYGSIDLEIFPTMNNFVLLKFNDTHVLDKEKGDIRIRNWNGFCTIKNSILTCKNNKEDDSEFSFKAKITEKSITPIEDNGFSNYVCGIGQYLRNKYVRAK